MVEFEWPKPVPDELLLLVHQLVNEAENVDWIEHITMATGGVGGDSSTIWIFRLSDYEALGKLADSDALVARAYGKFISRVANVRSKIRQELEIPILKDAGGGRPNSG